MLCCQATTTTLRSSGAVVSGSLISLFPLFWYYSGLHMVNLILFSLSLSLPDANDSCDDAVCFSGHLSCRAQEECCSSLGYRMSGLLIVKKVLMLICIYPGFGVSVCVCFYGFMACRKM